MTQCVSDGPSGHVPLEGFPQKIHHAKHLGTVSFGTVFFCYGTHFIGEHACKGTLNAKSLRSVETSLVRQNRVSRLVRVTIVTLATKYPHSPTLVLGWGSTSLAADQPS